MGDPKIDLATLAQQVSFDVLPDGFVVAKPLKPENYKETFIYDLEEKGKLIITRKRNGWKIFASKSSNVWKLFTDGGKDVTEPLYHIRDFLDTRYPDIPNNTLFVGEGVVPNVRDNDMLTRAQSVFASRADQSIALQKKHGRAQIRFFDIAFFGGTLYWGNTGKGYRDRLQELHGLFGVFSAPVAAVEILEMTFDQAKQRVRKKRWEGLVLYDEGFTHSFRLDGKEPERVRGAFKWKPIYEDDFIAYESILENGRLKEVKLAQIDSKTGRQFDCGKCGNFTQKMRDELTHATYPFVMEIAFEFRFPTGKLQNKRFVRLRPDKKVSHCFSPRNFAKKEFI